MNRSDALYILHQLQPLPVEEQLTALRWLMSPTSEPLPPSLSQHGNIAIRRVLRQVDGCSNDPWKLGDDTFDEVLEALETDMVGECDCCGQYSALRNGEASGVEASMCKWGCKP